MRNALVFLVFIVCVFQGNSQVGINTTDPQEALHIGGQNSTIRIESLNSVNSPIDNDGINLAPVFVNANGDIVINDGSGTGSSPINFLIEQTNFIPDDPYGIGVNSGYVVNSPDNGATLVEGEIITVPLVVPQNALVEVKYGITVMIEGSDISSGVLPYNDLAYDQSVVFGSFFCIDLDGGGLNPTERSTIYGRTGQYYVSNYGGITNYTYINGQAYLPIDAGTYTIYFFGTINDHGSNYTSAGFGGAMDLLKIRIYN